MYELTVIEHSDARSLVWQGDALVDWASGGDVISLDGTVRRAQIEMPGGLDAAVATPDGEWAVAYAYRGRTGVLFRNGQIVRELPRAEYHAADYMYPMCVWRDANGRALLAHCPREYDTIDIEVAETGELLTDDENRQPTDFFHSRLQVSPNGRWLLSAGWVWHPWDAVTWFDVAASLSDPTQLDGNEYDQEFVSVGGDTEMSFGTWRADSTLLIATSGEESLNADEDEELPRIPVANGVAVYDLDESVWLHGLRLRHPPGYVMPVGSEHLVSLWEHPRLYRLRDGALLYEWSDVGTGTMMSSIIVGDWQLPVFAVDVGGARLAIAAADRITVIQLDPRWIS